MCVRDVVFVFVCVRDVRFCVCVFVCLCVVGGGEVGYMVVFQNTYKHM